MALVVCVVSRTRGRGKTALIGRLTQRLTEDGFKVATVKHISGSFDTAQRDTWRHLEAGAVLTVASTPNEIVTVTRTKDPPLQQALDAIYTDPDITFVEGYKKSAYPKILCAETAQEAQAALNEISNVVMISGLISANVEEKKLLESQFPNTPVYDFAEIISALKEMLATSVFRGLPGLNCKHCGYDSCLELAKAILRREATMKDCDVLATNIATLKVDGKNVPIGKFPQEIIRSIVVGILGTLKGVSKHPQLIEVTVKAGLEEEKQTTN